MKLTKTTGLKMKSKYNPKTDVGNIVGRYKVLEYISIENRSYFKVSCIDCKTERTVRVDSFKKSKDSCFSCDKANPNYKSRAYNSWDGMIQRCLNPNSTSYWKYGAVGIKVQDSWTLPNGEGFRNFIKDLGDCPDGMTLDRWPDKFGNYCKENVRWATNSEQGYNQKKRSTNTSGRTGVTWNKEKNKWHSQIWKDNKKIHLGYFDIFEDAVKAREEAELEYFGEVKE